MRLNISALVQSEIVDTNATIPMSTNFFPDHDETIASGYTDTREIRFVFGYLNRRRRPSSMLS